MLLPRAGAINGVPMPAASVRRASPPTLAASPPLVEIVGVVVGVADAVLVGVA